MKIPEYVSAQGLEIIKRFEKLHEVRSDGRVHAYRDPVGVWTIGYGHTKGVKAGQSVTKAQADQFLHDDIMDAVRAVRKYVHVPLTQNQFDSLVSFTFNLGTGNLRSSTLLRLLNQGNYDSVPEQLNRWNKGRVSGKLTVLRGLTRRRSAEGAMFMMDEKLPSDGGASMVQKPRAGTQASTDIATDKTIIGGALAGIGTVMTGILSTVGTAATSLKEVAQDFLPYIHTVKPLLYITLGITVIGLLMAARSEWKWHKEENT